MHPSGDIVTANGRITIGRHQDSECNSVITLTVEDGPSSKTIIQLEIDPASFAEAITGFAMRPCKHTTYAGGAPVWGKKMLTKMINLDITGVDYKHRNDCLEHLVREHEIDGWIGDRGWGSRDVNEEGKTYQPTTFRKYVETEEEGNV